MKKRLNFSSIIYILLILSSNTFAHSGGTNSYGCHTNHSTGDYHCHNPKKSEETKSQNTRVPASESQEKLKGDNLNADDQKNQKKKKPL